MDWWGGDLHEETLTLVKVTEGEPDDSGVPTTDKVSYRLDGYSVQQLDTSEDTTGGERVTTRYRVSGPVPDPLPAAQDRITWRDGSYRIDGRPNVFGAGALPHVEFVIIERKGT